MRLVIARCSVDYAGRLTAHLPLATRLLMLKGDGSVLVHSDSGSYKPLNWMNPPCTVSVHEPDEDQAEAGVKEVWRVSQTKTADILFISIFEVLSEIDHHLGEEPGLQMMASKHTCRCCWPISYRFGKRAPRSFDANT
jgi:RecB family endonuclease NucS